MRLHQAGLKQLVKPVGVAHLGLAQIGVARLLGVGQSIGARGRIVGVHQPVHLAVDAAVGRTVGLAESQPALLLHLLVDTHLLLRVHDVERLIGRHKANRIFARIRNLVRALAALLGRHHNHARHGARAVDRRGRTVLENLEALDVVGVQTRNGRTDKRLGIARRQRVGIHLGHILHNHTVDHPQRVRAAIDRRGTAHPDFGRGAERARHVLNRHARSAPLERTAYLGHTVELDVVGRQLRGRTRKQTLVDARHARHHHLGQVGRALAKRDAHLRLGLLLHRLVADELNHQRRVSRRQRQLEIAVHIGHSAVRGPLFDHRRTDNGHARCIDHAPAHRRCLGKYTTYAHHH